MLSLPFAPQSFEPVARRNAKVFKPFCVIYKTELSQRDRLDVRRKLSAAPAFPDRRRFGIAKANDHYPTITQNVMRYKAEVV